MNCFHLGEIDAVVFVRPFPRPRFSGLPIQKFVPNQRAHSEVAVVANLQHLLSVAYGKQKGTNPHPAFPQLTGHFFLR